MSTGSPSAPPHVEIEGPDQVNVIDGQSVQLFCSATGKVIYIIRVVCLICHSMPLVCLLTRAKQLACFIRLLVAGAIMENILVL